MSNCSVATGLLALVAVIHFAITVVLTVLVIWVRCYCKLRSSKLPEDGRPSTTAAQGLDSHSVAFCRRHGQVQPPDLNEKETVLPADIPETVQLTTSLPLPGLEIYNNQVASGTWEEESEKSERRNRTIEELRKDSTSSIKKPSSPFRRISSPRTRSGRFSLTGFLNRKSIDMDAEAINLMAPQTTSPTEESGSSLEVLEGSTQHILQHNEGDKSSEGSMSEHRHSASTAAEGTVTPPPIIILSTDGESQC